MLRAFIGGTLSPPVSALTSGLVKSIDKRDPASLATSLEADPHGYVLAVGQLAEANAIRTQVSLANARLPHAKIAIRILPVSYLGLSLAAASAAHSELSPTLAVQRFDTLIAQTWSATWMRSVSSLRRPVPTLGQHARSLMPGGAGFLVTHHPVSRVVAAGSSSRSSLGFEDTIRRRLFVAGTVPAKLLHQVTMMSGAERVDVVEAVCPPSAYPGARAFVEFAGFPDVAVDVSIPEGRCSVCSLPLATPICPFCRTSSIEIKPPEVVA